MCKKISSWVIELTGCFLTALATASFAANFNFPMTGFTGIVLILYRLYHLPLGVLNIILNIPLIILCHRILGKEFVFRSIRCMIVSSVIMDYLTPLLPVYAGERMLAALCTGILNGVGYALIYMQNSSTGGIDFIVLAIKVKKPHIAIGKITFSCATVVILVNWILFRDTDGVIYGLIINALCGYVLNYILYGPNTGKLMLIVTEHGKKIADIIEECCHRGSTILDVYGGYQQEKKQMVFCACSNKELYCLERAIKKVDPESFMTVWESKEVQGNGFHMFSLGQNHE